MLHVSVKAIRYDHQHNWVSSLKGLAEFRVPRQTSSIIGTTFACQKNRELCARYHDMCGRSSGGTKGV